MSWITFSEPSDDEMHPTELFRINDDGSITPAGELTVLEALGRWVAVADAAEERTGEPSAGCGVARALYRYEKERLGR